VGQWNKCIKVNSTQLGRWYTYATFLTVGFFSDRLKLNYLLSIYVSVDTDQIIYTN